MLSFFTQNEAEKGENTQKTIYSMKCIKTFCALSLVAKDKNGRMVKTGESSQ